MAHHAPYAPFSLECVQDIVRLVRSRTVRDELPLFAKCLHSLIGTVLGATIGEPEDVAPVFGSDAEVPVAELEDCKAALEEVESDGAMFGAAEPDSNLDPATLAMLIQLAVTLITKLIERRKNRR